MHLNWSKHVLIKSCKSEALLWSCDGLNKRKIYLLDAAIKGHNSTTHKKSKDQRVLHREVSGEGRRRREGEEAEGGMCETSLLDFSLIQCDPLFQFFFFCKPLPLTIISTGLIYAACCCCLWVRRLCKGEAQTSLPSPPNTMREYKSKDFWRAVLAELVGMTLFIFLSISTAIGNSNNTNPDQEVKVSLAFGLAIATLAQSLGHISGAHLNPAVTLGMLASCQISVLKAVMYIVAQMLGSALASGIVYGARPNSTSALGLNAVSISHHAPVQSHSLRFKTKQFWNIRYIFCAVLQLYLSRVFSWGRLAFTRMQGLKLQYLSSLFESFVITYSWELMTNDSIMQEKKRKWKFSSLISAISYIGDFAELLSNSHVNGPVGTWTSVPNRRQTFGTTPTVSKY